MRRLHANWARRPLVVTGGCDVQATGVKFTVRRHWVTPEADLAATKAMIAATIRPIRKNVR